MSGPKVLTAPSIRWRYIGVSRGLSMDEKQAGAPEVEEEKTDTQSPNTQPKETKKDTQPPSEKDTGWLAIIFNPSIWGLLTLIILSVGSFAKSLSSISSVTYSMSMIGTILAATLPILSIISLSSSIYFLSRHMSSPKVATIVNSSLITLPLVLCCASFMKPVLQFVGEFLLIGLQCFGLDASLLANVALANVLGGMMLVMISVIIMGIAAERSVKAEETTKTTDQLTEDTAADNTLTLTIKLEKPKDSNPTVKLFAVQIQDGSVIELPPSSNVIITPTPSSIET